MHLGLQPYEQRERTELSEELIYTNANPGEASNTGLCIWRVREKGLLRITFPDETQFWLDEKWESVWCTWPDSSSLEEACTYLMGPVFGVLLRLRGITCLHASAVNLEGRGVIFLGAAGAGKSTTAAAFAREGHPVLSDDIVPLVEGHESFQVIPAYPYLSLWPDSVGMLYGSPEALPRFTPGWEKRCLFLGKEGTKFESRPLPLAAIYILGERHSGSTVSVEALPATSALLSLLVDTYANKVLDRQRRGQEFQLLASLAATIPVRRVFPPKDGTLIGELCRVIHKDVSCLDFQSPSHL